MLTECRPSAGLLRNIAAAGAVDREFGDIFGFFRNFGPEMGSRRPERVFKRPLEAVGFNLAEFELKRSHGGPIRDNFYGFGTCELAQQCLRERYLCLRETYLCLRCYIYI